VAIMLFLVIPFVFLHSRAQEPEHRRPTVTEYVLADGTRCAVVWGPYTQPSGLSCDWRH
jgi:hypothetical protein